MHTTVVPSFPAIGNNNRPVYDRRVRFPHRDDGVALEKARPYVRGGMLNLGSATRPSFTQSR